METVDLLFVLAHPDDELLAAGTIHKLIGQGCRVGLMTLTCGSNGRNILGVPKTDLPAIRHAELLESASVLGVHALKVYPNEDARPLERPTMGAQTTPARFVGGLQDVVTEMIGPVAQDVIELRPRTVVTFGPEGYNGHPGHIAAHRIALAALERSGLAGHSRVYYLGTPAPVRPEVEAAWQPPTHRLDVTCAASAKLRAMGCYRSQALTVVDVLRRNPAFVFEEFFLEPGANLERPLRSTLDSDWLPRSDFEPSPPESQSRAGVLVEA